jgi:hypothetical protein
MVTYSVNMEELTEQVVKGPVNYTGGLQSNGVDVFAANKAIFINSLSALPAPIGGIITLLPNITYVQGEDLNIGTDVFALGMNTVWCGFESLNITLTYTGTGDLFTMVDTTNRIHNLTISATSGRLYNWSSTSGQQLRVTDVQSSSDEYGIFTGVNSILRFTNVSPSIATDGLEFVGSFASVLWEVSGAEINGGAFFRLGTAQFNSILVDKVLMTLAGGTEFINGLPNSGNISAGGLGTVLLTRIGGAGTPLVGVTPDDALWEFFHNDEIPDTRPDALLSMQNNAIETTITATDTPVLVAGVWTIKSVSQMTGDVDGRTTYIGGKDSKLPVTYSVSVEPASGTNIKMSAYVAIDGVVDPDSKRSGTASSGSPSSITIPWQDSFSTNGYHEVFVENNDNTTNILVESAISRTN